LHHCDHKSYCYRLLSTLRNTSLPRNCPSKHIPGILRPSRNDRPSLSRRKSVFHLLRVSTATALKQTISLKHTVHFDKQKGNQLILFRVREESLSRHIGRHEGISAGILSVGDHLLARLPGPNILYTDLSVTLSVPSTAELILRPIQMQRIELPGRTSSEIYQTYTLSLARDMFYKTSCINTDIEAATILRIAVGGIDVRLLRLVCLASNMTQLPNTSLSKTRTSHKPTFHPSHGTLAAIFSSQQHIHSSKSSPFPQTTHMDYSALLAIETFIMFIFLLPFYIVFFFMIV
jgi:hypothetical protein